MRTLILMVIVSLLVCACRKPEPIVHASYFVDNRSGHVLQLQGEGLHRPAVFLTTEIPIGSRTRFMDVAMGSGGHVLPSNFLSSFRVMAGDSLLYEGVNNSHWQQQDGKHHYVLVIE
jgi:hypothetical protein